MSTVFAWGVDGLICSSVEERNFYLIRRWLDSSAAPLYSSRLQLV